MNVADQHAFPDRDTRRSSRSQTEDDELGGTKHESEVRGEGGLEDSRLENLEAHDQIIQESTQDPDRIPGSVDTEAKGGVKEWISNKVLGRKPAEHQPDDQCKNDGVGVDDAMEATGGLDAHAGGNGETSELTTDSGELVRSTNDTPAGSFMMPLLGNEPAVVPRADFQEHRDL